MKLEPKSKKKIKKKLKKRIFFKNKTKLKKKRKKILGKIKKSEKNNAGKWAIFLPKTPKLKKPKNRKNYIFPCLLCAHSKFFMRQLFDAMLFSKKNFMIFGHVLDI